MLTSLLDKFVWPSGKKLALLPLAALAAGVFLWLCALAEWFPLPGVAEPTRSPHLWWLYTVFYFVSLIDTIGLASRESPEWFRVPADAALRGIVYPVSIVVARLFLPLVTCGFLDATTGVWAGPIAAFVYRHHFAPSATFDPIRFIRGARRRTEASELTGAQGGPPHPPTAMGTQPANVLPWFGFPLPRRNGEAHFTLIGTPGSGKSLAIHRLMAAVLPSVRPGADLRAIAWDVKGDMLSFLHQIGIPPELVVVLNPFDGRSHAWDISKDIDSPDKANRLAEALIPERPEDPQKFFSDAARAVLRRVIVKLLTDAPGAWTLRDLIHITASPKRMRAILSQTGEGRDFLDQFTKPPKTFRNFVQELGAHLRTFEAVAALWEHASHKFVASEWVKGRESIVLLDGRPENRATLVPLNRVLINVLSPLMTSGPESPGRDRFWVFLDELQEASRLDGIPPLLNLGRSKGIRCVLGFQDLEGLQKHWGRFEGEKLASLARNLSVLKLTSPYTAEWAARRFGECEVIDHRYSWGATTTMSEQFNRKPAVLPAEMLHLPDPVPTGNGIRVNGFHLLLGVNGVVERSAEFPTYDAIPALDYQPRPKEQQYLRPWSREDDERLGIGRTHSVKSADASRTTEAGEAEKLLGVEASYESGNAPEAFDELVDFTAPD